MKLKKTLGPLSFVAIITPFTISTINSIDSNIHNNLNHQFSWNFNQKKLEGDTLANKTIEKPDADFFVPGEDTFKVSELEDLANPTVDPSVWVPKYSPRNFDDAFAKQWYTNALQDGWRDLNQYQKYLQVVYEKYAKTSTSNTFGNHPQIEPETNWIAWHFNPGAEINHDYHDGRGSEVRPSWDNTANLSWNDIDDTIPWYYYEGSDVYQFLFDDNNIDNAWKRLEYDGRLVKVSGGEIQQEASDDGMIIRNKYMVDGKIVDELPYGVNYYYVSSEKEGGNFVRDDNGWKVIVTDQDKKAALTQIINPSNTISKLSYPSLYDRTIGSEKVPEKIIDYPTTYNQNQDYNLASRTNLTNKYHQFEGKYSITIKADNYTSLVNSPLTVFCYQISKSYGFYSRFGFPISGNHLFSGSWQTGQYAWMWVENGHGGYKIWKNLAKIPTQIMQWRADNSDQLDEGDANDFIFYGTVNRIFPKKDWLLNEPSFLNYNGF